MIVAALVLSTAVAGNIAIAQVAHASAGLPSWWSGDCDGRGQLITTDPALNLQVCYPSSYSPPTQPNYSEQAPGWVTAMQEWQCVELSQRYLVQYRNMPPISPAPKGGVDVATAYYAAYSPSHPEISTINGDVGQAIVPAVGDVISMGNETQDGSDGGTEPGHTGVISSVNVNASGSGTVMIVQQNSSWYSAGLDWNATGTGYTTWPDNAAPYTKLQVTSWKYYDADWSTGPALLHDVTILHFSSVHPYEIAFEGNNNELFKVGNQPATGTDMLEGMMSGTNPSIAALTSGGHETAFQANNTDLATVGDQPATGVDTHVGMMSGTSPSIAALAGGGYEIAFQANTGHLYVTGTAGTQDLQFGMMYNTSPSIAALTGGGYEIAFQSNNGQLWVTGPGGAGAQNLQFGMMGGTNPAIAPLPNNSYEVTFQSNVGQLWVTGPGGAGMQNLQFGMMSGTSPAIAELSNGTYEIAFQANTGNLWAVGSNPISGTDMQEGMKAGTNPSIIAFGSSYEIAFEGNNNELFKVGNQPATGTDMLEGMQAGTSPSIAG